MIDTNSNLHKALSCEVCVCITFITWYNQNDYHATKNWQTLSKHIILLICDIFCWRSMRLNLVLLILLIFCFLIFYSFFIVILLYDTILYFSKFRKVKEKYRYFVTLAKSPLKPPSLSDVWHIAKMLPCNPQKWVRFSNHNYSFIKMS